MKNVKKQQFKISHTPMETKILKLRSSFFNNRFCGPQEVKGPTYLVNIPHSLAITKLPKERCGIQSKVFREKFKAKQGIQSNVQSSTLSGVIRCSRCSKRQRAETKIPTHCLWVLTFLKIPTYYVQLLSIS